MSPSRAGGRAVHALPWLLFATLASCGPPPAPDALPPRAIRSAEPRAARRPEPTLASSGVPRLQRSECVTAALREVEADCYTFFGEEHWAEPNGTVVELPVAVIAPEHGDGGAGPPVFFFPGGPGYSILDHPEYIARLRRDVGERVLVLMDHRGFVHAEPALRCPDYAAVSPYHNVLHTPVITSSADPLERAAAITPVVEACYRKLADEGIAVAQYNSYAVSRDVDEIRRRLGYDAIDVFGSSTGSGTALLYLGYFPGHVRAALFGWPWYNFLRNRSFVDELHTAKQAFTDALSLCVAGDARCRRLLPAWLREIDRTRRILDDEPFVTTVEHDGERRSLRFDGAAFLDTLYLTLADDYAWLPRLIAEVRAGDYSSLPELFRIDRYDPHPDAPRYALGYFLAHVCNDMGANRPSRADSLAAVRREPAVLGFEPPWLCAWWGSDGDVPPEHNDPTESPVPALAIHGQLDPCCGTRWSERLAEAMPNLQIVELQGVGHGPTTECRSQLIADFLDDPNAPVDDGCADEVPLGPWSLEAPDPE